MDVTLYECCDCGEKFYDPDTQKDPDNDCCPSCGFDEIREIEDDEGRAFVGDFKPPDEEDSPALGPDGGVGDLPS